jgi:hypothetical protein
MVDISPIRTTISLAPGETVELIREQCDCPKGDVCPDGSLFADACPRRPNPPVAVETRP